MSDSHPPKSLAPRFEVPNLEVESVPRAFGRAKPARVSSAPPAAPMQEQGYSAPSLFDEDSFDEVSLSLDLDEGPRHNLAVFGGSNTLEDPGAFVLEPVLPTRTAAKSDVRAPVSERISYAPGAAGAWPTGRAPDLTRIKIDPVQAAILADYGEVPEAVQLSPGYAYRVFRRQRELKRQLLLISAECERAEFDREATLAELARAVRTEAERVPHFRALLLSVAELEQLAVQRELALASVDAELNAQSQRLDLERSQLTAQISVEEQLEPGALRHKEERESSAKRADAAHKRVQIELRAVMQVAAQKRRSEGEAPPNPDSERLVRLEQRAEALEPEVVHAAADLEQAQHALGQIRTRIDGLRQNERRIVHKQQELAERYHKLHARALGPSEQETRMRRALAALGSAVLSAAGSVDVPEPWLMRVRAVSDREAELSVRRELQRSAIDSYDRVRVKQGVRLACTVALLMLMLVVLKLVF